MIRRATRADIDRIFEIRNNVRENRLSDPSKVTVADVEWFIDHPGIYLWVEDDTIAGFSAADPRNGSIWALFLDERFEGRGIGRTLLEQACEVLQASGWNRIWLTTGPGTRAEQLYRKAGWECLGQEADELRFERCL
ncbi:GNAT family N-acetyltransferase [Peteryoungia desertarenae]|uniref:GNAT family N-acetyltransferase n=1 Tax=Peteryoungia desertarenae TaxID=1813451 RepID=A0ABX6QSC9_9HYPH|nr:GNAT family N-acetyltransferase [Peteryoungia desertarenae]QLF71100.1 GNAT family N-acetyltransferase [Peteryoungia desertarenae]